MNSIKRRYILLKLRTLSCIFIGLLIPFVLSGCGNSQSQQQKSSHIEMTDNDISGGEARANHSIVVHSATELKSVLKEDKNKPKDILINSSLNGNTDGYLQDKIQLNKNELNTQIEKLNKKPRVTTYTNNINGVSKQDKLNAKKRSQIQWQKQKQQQRRLELVAKNRNDAFNKLIQQKTKDDRINIPSNTTIAEDPNTKLQNITFVAKGHNIIFRNLSMQSPINYLTNTPLKNDAIKISHANGVLLEHNTFTDSELPKRANRIQKGSKLNKNVRNYSYDCLTDITNDAKHVVIKHNRYVNANRAIMIGNPYQHLGNVNAKITNNLFDNVAQSAPQVCYGRAIIMNNYYFNNARNFNKYNSVWGYGTKANLRTKNNTFKITRENSKQVARKLLQWNKRWFGTSVNSINNNINNNNFRIIAHGDKVQILKNDSSYQPASIDNFAKDGAILGRNEALGD